MQQHLTLRLLASTSALALVGILASGGAAQSPQAPVVAAGAATVTRQGSATVVTQSTDKGIVDWRSFSVGPQEVVRFDQPGRSSVTLNRVTGTESSRIDGAVSATGQVWLANPNGVLIGPGGQVNVAGLLATTGRIDAAEFMRSGRAVIDQVPGNAAIVNGGAITIGGGGYAALAAAAVKNQGVIFARAGTVAMGAGKAMTLDFSGDKLIAFQVTQPLDLAPEGADALISNQGSVIAPGGSVRLSARAAKGVIDSAINLNGHVIAKEIHVDGGTVTLGDGGAVRIGGTLDVSDSAGRGGVIAAAGQDIAIARSAVLDAHGAAGGEVTLRAVEAISLAGKVSADGAAGVGGKISVKAGAGATIGATVSASGGVVSGDGGSIVIASPGDVRVTGALSANAPAGVAGTVVIAGGMSIRLEGSQITAIGTGGGGLVSVGAYLSDAGYIVPATQALQLVDAAIDASAAAPPVTRILADGSIVNPPLSGAAGGKVTLASAGETTVARTTISARSDAGKGGAVDVLGDKVGLLDGASIDASGATGGGVVRVGGDWQGEGGTQTAQFTHVAPTAAINVDATGRGDGGKAVVWAEDSARFHGRISARGGAQGGDGGQVETSGKRGLDVATAAIVDASARTPESRTGDWLLDPSNITIRVGGDPAAFSAGVFSPVPNSVIDPSYISAQLALTNVTIRSTASGGSGVGNITFSSGTIDYAGAGQSTLTLEAFRNIYLQAGTKIISSSTGKLNVTLNSGATAQSLSSLMIGGISIGAMSMSTNGGAIRMVGGRSGALAASGSGDLNSGITLDGATLDAGAGAILLNGAGRRGSASPSVVGVDLRNSSLISSGAVTLTGTGGNAAQSNGGFGVNIQNSGIAISGAGSLTVTGVATAPGEQQAGVRILSNNGTSITLETGTLSISGTASAAGGGNGVFMSTGASITSGGAITIKGFGGAAGPGAFDSTGVRIDAATISANGAATVAITGTRGASLSVGVNDVGFVNGAAVSTDAGGLTVIGTATTGGGDLSNNAGVYVNRSKLLSNSGNIRISGAGASQAGASYNHGVSINNASVVDAGGGRVVVNGVSGAGGSYGVGVNVSGSTVAGSGGVAMQGQGGAGAGLLNVGVQLMYGARVEGRGAGSVSINGTASGASPDTPETGVSIANAIVASADGSITVSGKGDGGGAVQAIGINIRNVGGTIASAGSGSITLDAIGSMLALNGSASSLIGGDAATGSILIRADQLIWGTTLVQTAGRVTIEQSTPAVTIGVGGAAGRLAITNGILASISAGAGLRIRSNGADRVMVENAVSSNSLQLVQDFGPITIKNVTVTGAGNGFRVDSGFPINLQGLIRSEGSQTFLGPVNLQSAATLSTAGASIAFGSSSSGVASALTGVSELILKSEGGRVTLPSSINLLGLSALGGGAVSVGGDIRTFVSQYYGGQVVLRSDATFTADMGAVTFAGPVDGAVAGNQGLVAHLGGSAILSLAGGVGANTPLRSLTTIHDNLLTRAGYFYGSTVLGGVIRTTGAQFYDSVALASDTTLSTTNAPITFLSSLDGPGRLTLATGSGNIYGPPQVGVRASIEYPTLLGTTQFGVTPSQPSMASRASVASENSRAVANPASTPPSLTTNPSYSSIQSIPSIASRPSAPAYVAGMIGPRFASQPSIASRASMAQSLTGRSLPSYPSVASTVSDPSRPSAPSLAGRPIGPAMQSAPSMPSMPSVASSPGFLARAPLVAASVAATTPSVATSVSRPSTPSAATVSAVVAPSPSTPTPSSPSPASTITPPIPAPLDPGPPLVATVLADTGVVRVVDTPAVATMTQRVTTLLAALDPALSAPAAVSSSVAAVSDAGAASARPTPTASPTATVIRDLVWSTEVGAVINFMPEFVPGTRAPLSATATIKVDPIDTGGVGGQVIARYGVAARQDGNEVLPGLLKELSLRDVPFMPNGEPPLSQQASTMEDTHLMD